MTVEVHCQACGRRFLVEEADSKGTPCPACGTLMEDAGEVAPGAPPSTPPARDHVKTAEEEIVCPRCSLHFVPRKKRTVVEGERRTVLVVEDMDYFLEIARDALKSRFQVKTARSLDEARMALAGGGIDLILLDLTLEEGENGIDWLRELPFKPCPILIYTAEEESLMDGDAWKELQDLGADDVVIKTMNVGESILRKAGALLGEPLDDESSA